MNKYRMLLRLSDIQGKLMGMEFAGIERLRQAIADKVDFVTVKDPEYTNQLLMDDAEQILEHARKVSSG